MLCNAVIGLPAHTSQECGQPLLLIFNRNCRMHIMPVTKSANCSKLKSQYQPDRTGSLHKWQGKCSSRLRSRMLRIVQNGCHRRISTMAAILDYSQHPASVQIHKQVYLGHFCTCLPFLPISSAD